MFRVYGVLLSVLALIFVAVFAYKFIPAMLYGLAVGGGYDANVAREIHAEMESYCTAETTQKPDIYVYQTAENVTGFQIGYDYGYGNGCSTKCKWALLSYQFNFVEVYNSGYASVSTLVDGPGLFRMTLVDDSGGNSRADCGAFYEYRAYEVETHPPRARERLEKATPTELAEAFYWPPDKCITVEKIDQAQARYVLRGRYVKGVKEIAHGQIGKRIEEIYDRENSKVLAEIINYTAPAMGEPVGAPEKCQPPDFPVTGIDLVKATLIKAPPQGD